METASEIGAIGLECLMSRANIIFTSGYKFRGSLDIPALERSFLDIVDCIPKFGYRLHFEAQNRFHWERHGPYQNLFLSLESDDIDQGFKDLCARSFEVFEDSHEAPMIMAVIQEKAATSDSTFIIAQLSNHTYIDAGSAEVIFHKVIDHYHALIQQDDARITSILDETRQLKTIDASAMVKILQGEHFDHHDNLEKLSRYPVADVGNYQVPLKTIPEQMKAYKQRVRTPISRHYEISRLVKRCRAAFPEVTKNSAICALLSKGLYELNLEKGKPDKHLISCKMLSNILPAEMRSKYSGNYISFIPVSVEGHKEIEEMAKDIHDRIREFKSTQLNLSLYRLVDDAVKAASIDGSDDDISYVVTSWNNYAFLNNPEFLSGCESLKHISGVNIEPKDALGGCLVNRPVMVTSLSPGDDLCLSFFPSLRSDEETRDIIKHIDQVFRVL
jgi:hypothetical protein